MDLHLHTPASVDYREANVAYLDFLKKAEERGLDIVAFTDHNTVAGYARYLDEVETLELLEKRNRLTDAEREQLGEYRRLQDKLLILPGFELTATLGFHILGIFPPDTTVRELEHLLLDLRVPPDKLDLGSGEVGATSDVLTAYRLIDEAGGLVIAAHANSSHGVAMPGFDFGGQTRISYTQDVHLHALEVTDLTSRSRRRTALFFSGSKPEYPRKMHLIQSSDAHRLTGIPGNNQELGIGDRATESLLDELSFEAIKDVFLSNDFARTRPYVPAEPTAYDPILQAREEGDTLVQAFHEHLTRGRGVERKILQDVVALANTNGGTIYIGLSANVRAAVRGVQRPGEAIHQLKTEIARSIVPPLEVQLDSQKIGAKSIVRIIVPRGSEVPYALDATQIYIRSENETSLAVRDEIVNLVRDSVAMELAARPEVEEVVAVEGATAMPAEPPAPPELPAPPPRTGVEVIPAEKRKGEVQYSVRDLRNNRIIHNVTRSSARKLWQYAISEYEEHPVNPEQVKWVGEIGLCNAHKRAGKVRFDLVQRDSAGQIHVYYGVTEDGIHGPWKVLIEGEGGEPVEEAEYVEAEEAERHEPESLEAEEEGAETATGIEREFAQEFYPTFPHYPPLLGEEEGPGPEFTQAVAPDDAQVTQWPPQEMISSAEQEEPAPTELDVDSGEPRSISEMGFEVESVPTPEEQPAPLNLNQPESVSEQTTQAEAHAEPVAPNPAEFPDPQNGAAQSEPPAEPPPLFTQPGRPRNLPYSEEPPASPNPLEIPPDTDTQGEPPKPPVETSENHSAQAAMDK
jgi:Schlafen, AlbA_2